MDACARKRAACVAGGMSGWLVILGTVMTGQVMTAQVTAGQVSDGPQQLLLQEDFDGPLAALAGRQANSGQVWRPQTARWSTGGLQTGLAFGQRHTAGGGWRDRGPARWVGNVIALGQTLQATTLVFGVDLQQGVGVLESCAALESADGVESLTLIWTGRRLKCGGNTWSGELDMGIAEGNVRVELIVRLDGTDPARSTATMRYIQLDDPDNQGSLDLGNPRNPDRNGSGSFEFSRVALHVLKGGEARFGFDNVSLQVDVQHVDALQVVPVSRKYLLLDHRLIAQTDNCVLRVGQVVKHPQNPLFGEEHEWESRFDNLYPNVMYDQEEQCYKIWYFTWTYDPATTDVPRDQRQPGTYMRVRRESGKGLREGLGYAVSQDGIHWEKPLMTVSPWKGQPSNLVAQPCHGAGIFKDLRERDPARRYKMFHKGQGMAARFSADGIHWGQYVPLPEVDAAGDTHNNALWSPELKKYVGFTRLWRDGKRVVGRTESPDFVYWTKAVEVLSDRRAAQPYSMPVIRYAGLYLGLPAILRAEEDRTHTELAWSADTVHWHRVEAGTPLIANAAQPGAYDWGTVYASYPIIQEDGIRIYYGAGNAQHFDWRDGSLCLATLRPDGFAGYEPERAGQPARLRTIPLEVAGPLQLTADAAGGAVVIRVLDAKDTVLLTSESINADVTDQPVVWRDGGSLRPWLGQQVQLQIEWKSAKIFALKL